MTTVKVHMLPQAMEALEAAAKREGLSRTDVINRAVQLYNTIGGAAPNTELTFEDSDGSHWMTVVKP